MDSETVLIVMITVVVCAVIAVGAWFFVDRARSSRLKQRFGPEYDRTVDSFRDRQLAETELQRRENRVAKYTIVALPGRDRASYRQTWTELQRRFVDDPRQAVEEGDRLIFEVMQKRGYPVKGFEQAAVDLSVDYPNVVTHYRAAAAIAARNRTGKAATEELRQALVHYRALFDELLESPGSTPSRVDSVAASQRKPRFKLPSFQNIRRGGLRS